MLQILTIFVVAPETVSLKGTGTASPVCAIQSWPDNNEGRGGGGGGVVYKIKKINLN
jgi:hypothetical protein